MNEWIAYLTVFVAAAIPWLEVLLVVPAGIVAGLPPGPTAVVGAAGNAATLVPLVFAGDRLRGWWRTRRSRKAAGGTAPSAEASGHRTADPGHGHGPAHGPGPGSATAPDRTAPDPPVSDPGAGHGRGGRARRLFDRFGLPGLALLGPLLTGVHFAALVALAAGARRRPTTVWLLGGVVGWSALAAAATVFGLEALVDPDRLPQLFDATP